MDPEQNTGVVVIVEDPFITKFLHSALARAGQVSIELSAKAAVEFLATGQTKVRALITNTPQLFRPFAGRFPVIYTTSCPVPEATEGFPTCRTLRKPFHGAEVLDALREVCAVGIR